MIEYKTLDKLVNDLFKYEKTNNINSVSTLVQYALYKDNPGAKPLLINKYFDYYKKKVEIKEEKNNVYKNKSERTP